MHGLWAKWSIGGIIVDTRVLTSHKNKDWRGYLIKVAGLGQTFEISCTAEQQAKLAAGEHYDFRGTFEEQKGQSGTFMKLILDAYTEPKKAGDA